MMVSAPPQPPTGEPLRILIADDDPVVRSALRSLIASQPDLCVDEEAVDGPETVELAVRRRPDIVLLDEGIGGLDAMHVITRIRDRAAGVQVVVFSAAEDIERGVEGLRSGATGFLLKEMSSEALVRALRGLAHGEAALSRSLTLRLVEQLHHDTEDSEERPIWTRLTIADWQILDLLGRGDPMAEVADTLGVPMDQLHVRVEQILRKLEVATLADALTAATRLRAGEAWPSEGATLDEVTRRRLERRRPPRR